MSAARTTSTRGSRSTAGAIGALVLLGASVAGAVVLVGSEPSAEVAQPLVAAPVDGPTVPSPDAVSSAWYCSEGTSTADGRADETVIIGNLSEHPIDVSITVMPGGDAEPEVRRREIDTLAQERIEVSDILATPEPGVVVEVFGGQAVVEHELRGRNDVAVGPCARAPSRHWFFAAGTTARGAEEWLALFNPFGDDAIVDISFLTDGGFQAPGATQAFVVPRRSRVSLPVHEHVRRQEAVAIAVRVTTGRVVAERSLRFDGTDARSGLAVSLGVTGSAGRWLLPAGDGEAGAATSIAVANFGSRPTEAEVRVTLDGDAALEPQTVDVSARGIAHVDLADSVRAGTDFSVEVEANGEGSVVVEALGVWASPATVGGVATAPGSVTTSTRWAFAVGRLDDQGGDAVLTAVNVSDRPLTVELFAYTAGDPDSPRSAPAVAVPPGERGDVPTALELGVRPDMVLVVSADGPIVAGRLVFGAGGAGVSLAPGIPFEHG